VNVAPFSVSGNALIMTQPTGDRKSIGSLTFQAQAARRKRSLSCRSPRGCAFPSEEYDHALVNFPDFTMRTQSAFHDLRIRDGRP